MTFNLTGNEDTRSYTYMVKIDHNCSFSKKIIVNTNPNCENFKYDQYEEIFTFPDYYFIVGKHIDKIKNTDSKITEEFVKKYICGLENYNYCIRWNPKKERIILVNPCDNLKLYSEQLYNNYIKYYDRIINEKVNCFYYFLHP